MTKTNDEEKEKLYQEIYQQVKNEFYNDIDLKALFEEFLQESYLKYAGLGAIILQAITLVVFIWRT